MKILFNCILDMIDYELCYIQLECNFPCRSVNNYISTKPLFISYKIIRTNYNLVT